MNEGYGGYDKDNNNKRNKVDSGNTYINMHREMRATGHLHICVDVHCHINILTIIGFHKL